MLVIIVSQARYPDFLAISPHGVSIESKKYVTMKLIRHYFCTTYPSCFFTLFVSQGYIDLSHNMFTGSIFYTVENLAKLGKFFSADMTRFQRHEYNIIRI
jgi:hypothetical protein